MQPIVDVELRRGPMHSSYADFSAEDGLARALPADRAVSSRGVSAFIDSVETAGLEMHGLMIWRDNAVVAEGFHWPYSADRPRLLHSITKSFTACAIGLLIDEGRLALDDPIWRFFPEQPTPSGSALRRITVHDLLTMRVGHAAEVSGAGWREIDTSWIAEFFRIPIVHPPGAVHVYTSAASYMLSAIVSRITGDTLHAYLKPRLFAPLGIRSDRWDVGPDGINPGGNGITAHVADALKLGILHAQGGRWDDSQILPAWWVDQATRPQGDPHYGYHWVVGDRYFAALGVFVQAVFVYPAHRAVVAITGAMRDSKALLPHLSACFPSAFENAPTPDHDAALAERLRGWARPTPIRSIAVPDRVPANSRWLADENEQGLDSIELAVSTTAIGLDLIDAKHRHRIEMPLDDWREVTATLPAANLHHGYALPDTPVVAGACWIASDTLELTWHFVESAFRDVVTIVLGHDQLTLDRRVNINSAARAWPTIRARRIDETGE